MARSTTKSNSNSSNNGNNNSNKSNNSNHSNSRKPTANSSQPTANKNSSTGEDPGGIEPETFWILGGFGGRGACACACGLGGGWGVGGGWFLGEAKARPIRHYQLQLGPYKQKQSTDKQSIIKPHSTRHAGKAGGLISFSMQEKSRKRGKLSFFGHFQKFKLAD